MPQWKKGQAPAHWDRVEVVMKVQRGEISAAEAARILQLSRMHYYRLERELVSAALGAVTPMKRGPQRPEVDPKVRDLEEQVKVLERDRELLKLRLGRLQEIQKVIVDRGLAVEREKKVAGRGA